MPMSCQIRCSHAGGGTAGGAGGFSSGSSGPPTTPRPWQNEHSIRRGPRCSHVRPSHWGQTISSVILPTAPLAGPTCHPFTLRRHLTVRLDPLSALTEAVAAAMFPGLLLRLVVVILGHTSKVRPCREVRYRLPPADRTPSPAGSACASAIASVLADRGQKPSSGHG